MKLKVTLRALRTNYGLNQSQAAKLLGVNINTLYSYEHGDTQPKNSVIQRILHLFNVDYNDILFCDHISLKDRKED